MSTVKNSTTTEKAKEIVSSQKDDGSLELTDTVSKELNVESKESLISSVKSFFGNKLLDNKKLIDTALILSFLRKTSSTDTSPELKERVEKAKKYLKTELSSDEKIDELLERTDAVVVEYATKKIIKEKAEQSVVEEIQKTITEEEITEVIEIQNSEGSYEKISDKITEKLGVITIENISSSVCIPDKRVRKFDTKVWNTFITTAYCNKVLAKHKSKLTKQNEKALVWLHTQINDEKLEKEILESCEKIVAEKASNKKKESSWTSLSTWGSGWGKYIDDTAKSTTGYQAIDNIYHTADTPAKPKTESNAKPGWSDIIVSTEEANDPEFDTIEDSRYHTQIYNFSLDDLKHIMNK
ncbi:hypothetical protein RclHR1_02880014 [Rhizophagus clarus]|uniref:Uncharacterized protein n=1 Tax=Rhizophagus clarus TaxID=94130 RepID=A0A2Z6RYL5_9GLOM|nr:hypothetical protein RclHR1_02880014 [Rhizophagus clarus]